MRIPEHPPDISSVFHDQGADVAAALADPAYRKFIAQDRYLHWDRLRYKAHGEKVVPEIAWALIKMGRMQQYRMLPLLGHGKQHLRYMLPNAAQEALMLIDKDLGGRLSLDGERLPSNWRRERFAIGAIQEEAIASSMLEGAATTRVEAKELLRSGRKPRTHGETMVVNNYRTMLHIRDNKGTKLSPEFLLEVQRMITENTLEREDHVGRFRTDEDKVKIYDERDNEVMHTPPPADELAGRLAKLCEFANTPAHHESFIHPVVKACILHFQIGFDHPFCDGNGRTARAIFYWYLLRHGYWLFEYLPISPLYKRAPVKYARAYLYSETDDFDVTYFIMYNLRVISRGREDLWNYIKRKLTQVKQAHDLFKSDRMLNHRQKETLLKMTRNPDMLATIAEYESTFGVAYGTARSDLLDLVERNYLSLEKVRNSYIFSPGEKLQKAINEAASSI